MTISLRYEIEKYLSDFFYLKVVFLLSVYVFFISLRKRYSKSRVIKTKNKGCETKSYITVPLTSSDAYCGSGRFSVLMNVSVAKTLDDDYSLQTYELE